MMGFNITIYDGTNTTLVLKRLLRYHKKSKRWYKKFWKRYGTRLIATYVIPTGRVIMTGPNSGVVNPITYQNLVNHPDMKKMEAQTNDLFGRGGIL